MKNPTMSAFLQGLEASGWLKHIKAVVDTSVFIAEVSSTMLPFNPIDNSLIRSFISSKWVRVDWTSCQESWNGTHQPLLLYCTRQFSGDFGSLDVCCSNGLLACPTNSMNTCTKTNQSHSEFHFSLKVMCHIMLLKISIHWRQCGLCFYLHLFIS